MPFLKALYLNGKIKTGVTHADAYGQFSSKERNQTDQIISGFLNEQTGEFTDPYSDKSFYAKEIILIRHGSVKDGDNPDPDLSQQGRQEVERIAYYLRKQVDLRDYQAYVSPSLRCIRSAEIIAYNTRIGFVVDPQIQQQDSETLETFENKLKNAIDVLPSKSLVISHSPIIQGMVELAIGSFVRSPIPTGSLTIINKKQTICIGFKY